MYAIIDTGGKQYKVSQGDVIYVEKLDETEGNSVDFKVIAGQDDKGFYVGNPELASAKVSGKVLKNGKGKKKRPPNVLLFTLADNGIVIVYNNLPKSTAGRLVLLHLATKK